VHFQTFCTRRNLFDRSRSKRCEGVSLGMQEACKAGGVEMLTTRPGPSAGGLKVSSFRIA
jgi:hypothetical protein